jgi:hypothetical protein
LEGIIMNTKLTTIALILATGLLAGTQALAGVTREQVKAELAQAIRAGDMLAPGDQGQKLNELYPSRYPAKQAQVGVTREQVKAELAQAKRDGDFMISDSGQLCYQVHPNMHPNT